jgi:hypothetical protein
MIFVGGWMLEFGRENAKQKANFYLAKIEISPCDALHLSRDDILKICCGKIE